MYSSKLKYDPRDTTGPFIKLFQDLKRCKENSITCNRLDKRPYYWEPNSYTKEGWNREGMYLADIDASLVFVCESPGPRGKNTAPSNPERCHSGTSQTEKFNTERRLFGFDNCYVTNAVKCGSLPRGGQHATKEVEACVDFLVRELELIQPLIVVGVGKHAMHILRNQCLSRLKVPPVLFQITHYSVPGGAQKAWEKEFPELKRLVLRLRPRSEWGS